MCAYSLESRGVPCSKITVVTYLVTEKCVKTGFIILAKRVNHLGTLLLVSLFPLLEYNNYIVDSVLQLDVGGVS